MLFPFSEYWSWYIGFMVFILILLALDLGVFHKRSHEVSVKESAIWTMIWIGCALIFNSLLYVYSVNKFGFDIGKQVGLEFLTGYVVEKTLAVDNIFVFYVVFSYFKVPPFLQHRVLFMGIIGAIFFRAIAIALSAFLMQYSWVIWVFGGFLIFTGIKMLVSKEQEHNLEEDFLMKTIRKLIPIKPNYLGEHFFIRDHGMLYATPLFICLCFLELSDIVFALDSVPAIFALTKEPFIVFTSNIFAILGLRSMYFMLGGVLSKFIYLKIGLALVLVFVGCKMTFLNELFDGHFPIGWSLLIIATLIGGSIGASLWQTRDKRP